MKNVERLVETGRLVEAVPGLHDAERLLGELDGWKKGAKGGKELKVGEMHCFLPNLCALGWVQLG